MKPAHEPLAKAAERLKRVMADADCGPLIAAVEVLHIVDGWAAYEVEADGKTAKEWVHGVFGTGRGIPYFRRRAAAVETMGEDIRRGWNHEAAVWVSGLRLDRRKLTLLKDAYHREFKRNAGNPLSLERVRLLAEQVGVYRSPERHGVECEGCRRMAAMLRELGVDPAGDVVGVAAE